MKLFRFEGVAVGDPGAEILSGVTTELPDGGVTVVLGPSGAGKTTLLRLANRLEVPARGRVVFRGEDVAGLDPLCLRRRVGMVFQRPALFGGSVRDNLAVAVPGASDTEMVDALDRAALPAEFLGRVAGELSGGEAQRVCLARTLLTDPEVLLMDEPTAALDAGPRLGLERLALDMAGERGVPVVWVTHYLDQMERLADHVVVLVGGRVRFEGTAGGLAECGDPDVEEFLTGGGRAGG